MVKAMFWRPCHSPKLTSICKPWDNYFHGESVSIMSFSTEGKDYTQFIKSYLSSISINANGNLKYLRPQEMKSFGIID